MIMVTEWLAHAVCIICLCTFVLCRWPLSAGRCRGLSSTMFQLIFITNWPPHLTVYCRRPSFSGCRCLCLEQFTRTHHLCTFRGCLPVLSENSSVPHLVSHPLLTVQSSHSDSYFLLGTFNYFLRATARCAKCILAIVIQSVCLSQTHNQVPNQALVR